MSTENAQKNKEVTKLKFEILRDIHGPKTFMISAGNAYMFLETIDEYLCVNGVGVVDEDLRGQGIANNLYSEALNLAKKEGKKGIISNPNFRFAPAAQHIWQRLKEEGRVREVLIKGSSYDALLC